MEDRELKIAYQRIELLVAERDALAKINQQLQDEVEKLRNDNLQLIEQIGGVE